MAGRTAMLWAQISEAMASHARAAHTPRRGAALPGSAVLSEGRYREKTKKACLRWFDPETWAAAKPR